MSKKTGTTREEGMYPWYDSLWLHDYTMARRRFKALRPHALADFERAMAVLRTRPDFQVRQFEKVFDEETMARIRAAVMSLSPAQLELHEAQTFKRFVVHDHPYFNELQRKLVPFVSEAAGEEVEPFYNFLSLYSAMGVCEVHMDTPEAKWTLDLCIDQNAPWPIWFSDTLPWPDGDEDPSLLNPDKKAWAEAFKASGQVAFKPYAMEPGQAILFSGSSQWHYRDAMPKASGRAFCDLLFFHFVPAGSAELSIPANWARLFDFPELADVLTERQTVRLGERV